MTGFSAAGRLDPDHSALCRWARDAGVDMGNSYCHIPALTEMRSTKVGQRLARCSPSLFLLPTYTVKLHFTASLYVSGALQLTTSCQWIIARGSREQVCI